MSARSAVGDSHIRGGARERTRFRYWAVKWCRGANYHTVIRGSVAHDHVTKVDSASALHINYRTIQAVGEIDAEEPKGFFFVIGR